jgi:hypothetical protein
MILAHEWQNRFDAALDHGFDDMDGHGLDGFWSLEGWGCEGQYHAQVSRASERLWQPDD